LRFPERNRSSALQRRFLNCTRHVASNGDGKWGKYENGSWPVVIHSPYVVEALRYIHVLSLELRTFRNITQPAFSKAMDGVR